MTEHLVPFFPGFKYNPKDVRFVGTPIIESNKGDINIHGDKDQRERTRALNFFKIVPKEVCNIKIYDRIF